MKRVVCYRVYRKVQIKKYKNSKSNMKVHYLVSQNDNNSSPLLFSTVANEWLCSETQQLKESTIATYTHKLNKYIIPYFGENGITNINTQEIYHFINDALSNNLSRKYVSYLYRIIRAIYHFAEKKYGIKDITTDISIRAREYHSIDILNVRQQEELIKYFSTHQTPTTLAVALSYYAGLRIGEICALRWDDIDLNERMIYVNKTIQRIQCKGENQKTKIIITSPKSDSSTREIPIPPCLYNMILTFPKEQNQYIISQSAEPIEPRTLQYRFSRLLESAGLDHIRFHSLRHMFASNALALGFDVKALSEILGHSSANITLKTYVHSSTQVKRTYMDMIGNDFFVE